jgi:hypothetical protein
MKTLKFGQKKSGQPKGGPDSVLAEWTGLEPATPGVTGRYSNHLNYHSKILRLVGAAGIEPATLAL